ncbi:hypothetical protein [Ilumatobacter sp.]|uniref:hypothetical protein n=1 Tax=Ilumatobacter sp. TaxID=1967498 RepID=UPI003B520E1B
MHDPLWKRAFDAVETRAAPVLTKVFANEDVIEAMRVAAAVRKRTMDDLGDLIRRNLHTVNLPSGTDVRKVSNQVASLERQIRVLDRRIDELRAEGSADDS